VLDRTKGKQYQSLRASADTNNKIMMMMKLSAIFSFASAALMATTSDALSSMADPSSARSINPTKDFKGGAGVGRLIFDGDGSKVEDWECKYDMVLVERIQGRPKTDSGLFVPRENLPKLHLCKVISMGPGREEENGMIAPMPNIKIGDVVIAKNPWGIGPKDEETTEGKKLSFMRSQDIAAVVEGTLLEEK
jgi:co-chaperonin GroES (HSP10)